VEGDVEPVGDAPSVFGIRRTTAALLMVRSAIEQRQQGRRLLAHGARRRGLLAMPHEYTHDFVVLLEQQMRGDAAVDASRHCQYNSRHAYRYIRPAISNLPITASLS